MLKGFSQLLKRMLAEAAAADILNAINLGGEGNSGGNLNAVFKGVGDFFGGNFADGGRPPSNKISIVGERGPELFVPDGVSGTVIPNGQMNRGGSTVTIGSMVFPGVTNEREARLAGGAAAQQILTRINGAGRYA